MGKVCCIFAHPDDETAAAGTIALLAQHQEVYIICATSGDGGENHLTDKHEMLPLVREDELRASAAVLGVKQVMFLGEIDGEISNSRYHEVAHKIINILEDIQPEILITFEPRGITGHIDHIGLSFIATYVFFHQQSAVKLMYACMPEEQRAHVSKLPEYFIYFPPGYKKGDVDEVVDVSSVWEKKIAAIKSHASQKKDIESFMLPMFENSPKEEYFLIVRK